MLFFFYLNATAASSWAILKSLLTARIKKKKSLLLARNILDGEKKSVTKMESIK